MQGMDEIYQNQNRNDSTNFILRGMFYKTFYAVVINIAVLYATEPNLDHKY